MDELIINADATARSGAASSDHRIFVEAKLAACSGKEIHVDRDLEQSRLDFEATTSRHLKKVFSSRFKDILLRRHHHQQYDFKDWLRANSHFLLLQLAHLLNDMCCSETKESSAAVCVVEEQGAGAGVEDDELLDLNILFPQQYKNNTTGISTMSPSGTGTEGNEGKVNKIDHLRLEGILYVEEKGDTTTTATSSAEKKKKTYSGSTISDELTTTPTIKLCFNISALLPKISMLPLPSSSSSSSSSISPSADSNLGSGGAHAHDGDKILSALVGLLKISAKELFHLRLSITTTLVRSDELEYIEIELIQQNTGGAGRKSPATAANSDHPASKPPAPTYDHQQQHQLVGGSGNITLNDDSLSSLFPFFLAIDSDLIITNVGHKLHAIYPLVRVGARIQDLFDIVDPVSCLGCWSWEGIVRHSNLEFSVRCVVTSSPPPSSSLSISEADNSNNTGSSRSAAGGGGSEDDGHHGTDHHRIQLSGRVTILGRPVNHPQSPTVAADLRPTGEQQQQQGALFLLQPDISDLQDMLTHHQHHQQHHHQQQHHPMHDRSKCSNLTMLSLGDIPRSKAASFETLLLRERVRSSESEIARLKRDLDAAQRSLEMKRMFVRYVSHEIRTPLNTVAMGLKLMQESSFASTVVTGGRGRGTGRVSVTNRRNSLRGGGGGIDTPVRRSDDDDAVVLNDTATTANAIGSAGASHDGDDEPKMLSDHDRTESFGDASNHHNMAAEIKESCDIAIDIVNDLLLYEKLEGGLLQLEKQKEPVLSTVIEAVKTFEIQANQAKIDLQFTFDANSFSVEELNSPELFMLADKPKISQVLRNLVSNAIKFSPSGGIVCVHVSVCCSEQEQQEGTGTDTAADKAIRLSRALRVTVKDSGAGISAENQKKLFSNIVQFDANKLQGGGGSGLGLYISKGIMDLHGGTIGVFSEGEGKGTSFYIEVPIISPETASVPVPAVPVPTLEAVASVPDVHRSSSSSLCSYYNSSKAMPGSVQSNIHLSVPVTPALLPPETAGVITETAIAALAAETNNSAAVTPSRRIRGAGVRSRGRSFHAALRSGKGTKAAKEAGTSDRIFAVSLKKFKRDSRAGSNASTGTDGRSSECSGCEDELVRGSSHSSRLSSSSLHGVVGTNGSATIVRPPPALVLGLALPSMKILIVDDSRTNRRMAVRYLKAKNVCKDNPPDEAEDGKQALDMVIASIKSGEPYCAVLMDYVMPVMDGPTATKLIREAGYTGQIFGVTGNVRQEEVDTFLSSGANLVMGKPLDIDKLTALLQQAIADFASSLGEAYSSTSANMTKPRSYSTHTLEEDEDASSSMAGSIRRSRAEAEASLNECAEEEDCMSDILRALSSDGGTGTGAGAASKKVSLSSPLTTATALLPMEGTGTMISNNSNNHRRTSDSLLAKAVGKIFSASPGKITAAVVKGAAPSNNASAHSSSPAMTPLVALETMNTNSNSNTHGKSGWTTFTAGQTPKFLPFAKLASLRGVNGNNSNKGVGVNVNVKNDEESRKLIALGTRQAEEACLQSQSQEYQSQSRRRRFSRISIVQSSSSRNSWTWFMSILAACRSNPGDAVAPERRVSSAGTGVVGTQQQQQQLQQHAVEGPVGAGGSVSESTATAISRKKKRSLFAGFLQSIAGVGVGVQHQSEQQPPLFLVDAPPASSSAWFQFQDRSSLRWAVSGVSGRVGVLPLPVPVSVPVPVLAAVKPPHGGVQ